MENKTKLVGLLILLAVIAAGSAYVLLGGGPADAGEPMKTEEPAGEAGEESSVSSATLRGYVGGEKIGLLEDPEVENVLLPVRDGINIVRKL